MHFRALIFINLSYAPAHLSSLTETDTLFLMLMVLIKINCNWRRKEKGIIMRPFPISCDSKQKSHLKSFFFFPLTGFLTSKKCILKKKKKKVKVSLFNTFISQKNSPSSSIYWNNILLSWIKKDKNTFWHLVLTLRRLLKPNQIKELFKNVFLLTF